MNIRHYQAKDKNRCIEIFDSNCPAFFDPAEREPFIKFLDHLELNETSHPNSEKDYYYYVLETYENGLIGCGGFYFVKGKEKAQLAWGMIHSDFHNQGYGTALFKHRKEQVKKLRPNYTISLGTSQHTYSFFEKLGFKVTNKIPQGYGKTMDRYDME